MRLILPSFAFFLCAALAACAPGTRSEGFRDPELAQSYIGLANPSGRIAGGAGIVIAPGIAVTNKHNSNLVDAEDILAVSARFDLLFFRSEGTAAVRTAEPRPGLEVIAYGQGNSNELREARGVIELLRPSAQECPGCPPGTGFAYRAAGGRGFSGGPVTDAETGAVLGLTFAYLDSPIEEGSPRLMLAYDMAQVRAEFALLLPQESQ